MNLCTAILILKIDKNKQHFQHVMLYFKKGKNAPETQKKISAVCGEGAETDRMCQRWFAKFPAGDSSLDDAPRLVRPVEVDSDRIETLTENNQRSTTQERTDVLKIPKSIKLLVKMKNVFYFTEIKKPYSIFGQPSISPRHIPFKRSLSVTRKTLFPL